MNTLRLAVAGRYPERHTIKFMLIAQLYDLPVQLTASWLDCTEGGDSALTDEQAVSRANQNELEIMQAHALIYMPSWLYEGNGCGIDPIPRWSPGRLIDFGMAFTCRVPIIVVGKPEPTIYQRGELVTVCEVETLRETVKLVLAL